MFKFGTLNVHRADCNRKHPNPCDPWSTRAPRVVRFLREQMRCSVYALEECLPEQAADITAGLGWGTDRNPAHFDDENFNAVAIDREKWTDLQVRAVSLTANPGDVGDLNRRSALWVQLYHLEDKVTSWFGAAHFETGSPAARAVQAAKYAAAWPRAKGALDRGVAGIDRNSFTRSPGQPRDILLRAGIREAAPTNPRNERSFNGFGEPELDGKCIDGMHYAGPGLTVRSAALVSTVGLRATDHSGLTLSAEVAS